MERAHEVPQLSLQLQEVGQIRCFGRICLNVFSFFPGCESPEFKVLSCRQLSARRVSTPATKDVGSPGSQGRCREPTSFAAPRCVGRHLSNEKLETQADHIAALNGSCNKQILNRTCLLIRTLGFSGLSCTCMWPGFFAVGLGIKGIHRSAPVPLGLCSRQTGFGPRTRAGK